MSLSEDVYKGHQRGLIVETLMVFYPDAISFSDLLVQMVRAQSQVIDARGLAYHIGYLKDGGYILTERLRSGKADLELQLVRVTARGIDLKDGRIAEDPGVIFG
jgi:hypothetical protein